MSATGGVTRTEGKRWLIDDEALSPAALDETGMPVFTLEEDSIGTDELIEAEILQILEDGVIGKRGTFVFQEDVILQLAVLTAVGDISIPGATLKNGASDPVAVTQSQNVLLNNVWFSAKVTTPGNVKIFAWIQSAGPVTIPSGTLLEITVFTNEE